MGLSVESDGVVLSVSLTTNRLLFYLLFTVLLLLLALVVVVYKRRRVDASAVYTQMAAAGLSKKQRRQRAAELLMTSPHNQWVPELADVQRAEAMMKGYTRKQRRNHTKVKKMRRANKKSRGGTTLCEFHRNLRNLVN